ncbi:hypothetical protein KAK11_18975 [Ideonella paludis]|uniref:Transmembrane protein n=2 Tax=Ideonella paludis TaxID=1233411 RepID=A0ABS5E325_9BURK|nr:hypothetical protein [Ideonella paludis]
MRQWLKGLALLVAITCLVWVGVLWYWQATSRDMSPEDIVLYLGLLPLVVFGLVLLARWALRAAVASAVAQEAAAAAQAAATASPAPSSAGQQERHAAFKLLAAGLSCAAGQSAREVAGALAEGAPRPAPDKVLRDDEGLPVLCARIEALDTAALQQAWEGVCTAAKADLQMAETAQVAVDDAVQRALSALQAPLQQCLAQLAAWSERFAMPDAEAPQAATSALPAGLRVFTAWPSHWSPIERAVAQAWVKHCLKQESAEWLAPSQLRLMPSTAGGGIALWLEADRALRASQREGLPEVVLLLSCQSDLSDARLSQLQREASLFTHASPKAGVAAESAVALALADETWPDLPDAPATPMRLHRAAVIQRDKPIEAAGRVSAQVAEQVVQQAAAAAELPLSEVSALISDADQHSPRGAELFSVLVAQLPQLDAAEDTLVAGALWGRTGPTAPLMLVALAAHRAEMNQQPCLALSVDDSVARMALVLRPPAAADAEPTKSTS